MKKKKIYRILVIPFIFLASFELSFAQIQLSLDDAKALVESVRLVTDRNVYCVGEDILFSIFNTSPQDLKREKWSHVVYVELITASGDAITQKKFDFSENGAYGKIIVPRGILTGNYYIRTYTRWMRNFSSFDNDYQLITIINPYQNTLLEPESANAFVSSKPFVSYDRMGDILLRTNKKIYGQNDSVFLELELLNNMTMYSKFAVSVVRKGSAVLEGYHGNTGYQFSFSPRYIPETRGVTISGTLKGEKTGLPSFRNIVSLTLFKEYPENLSVKSNKDGRFFIDLFEQRGTCELFISAKPLKEQKEKLQILIDNDFSSESIDLPFVPVNFTEEKKILLQNMFEISQINNSFRSYKKSVDQFSGKLEQPFYGDGDFILVMDDFVALPTMQDYFHELIPFAQVREVDGKASIKVVGDFPELETYDPLIMVDMVPVYNMNKVLAIKPEKIKRVEVIRFPYIRGSITYGGIISFFSREKDLAGTDLPPTGLFFNYKMLEAKDSSSFQLIAKNRIPAISNCLYWNSSLKIKNMKSRISFSTGLNLGDYQVVVTTVDKDGKLKVAYSDITIR